MTTEDSFYFVKTDTRAHTDIYTTVHQLEIDENPSKV